MVSCPRIVCLWGFSCAYCFDDTRHKYPICEKHKHIWDSLKMNTRVKVATYVSLFNNGKMNRRSLQIFINKIEILDELNKLYPYN